MESGSDARDISPASDEGILKSILTPGFNDETPGKGDKVFVHYTGCLIDGTQFDSSIDRGELFSFTLGKGEVIKAWDFGVATMTKGEKCRLICKPEYAYGKKGSPPKIPENATLIFEVELIKWQLEDLSIDKDNGILRSIIQEGEGYLTPNEGATVEVHILGKCLGKVFEERDVKYQVGEGGEVGIVEGLDIAIKKFTKGEKARIILLPKYAFGLAGEEKFNIPPSSTIEYEVTLNSFEKEKESWNMTTEEKLEQSEIVKNKGSCYFKNGKLEMALKQYQKISHYLQYESETVGEQKEKKNSLLLAGYLNLAACYLKLENYPETLKHCEKALELEPKNVKGLFRRGQAHLALKDYETAKEDFRNVLTIDGTNKAAQKNIYICAESLKKELEREKQMYKTIFQKMAQENEKIPTETSNQKAEVEKIETDDEKQAAAEALKV